MAAKRWEQIKMSFVYWLARHLPDCKSMTQTMSESLDRNLPMFERIQMKLHLWICDACARYLKQLLFLRDVLRQQAEEPYGDASLSSDARERMKRALTRD